MPFEIKQETKVVDVIVGFTCDVCGNKYDDTNFNEHVHINHTFGYFSGHDCDVIDVVICEPCFYDILIDNTKTRGR